MIPENTEFIISKQYDGKSRRLYKKTCPCGKDFYIPACRFDEREHCSKKCSDFYKISKTECVCAFCGQTFQKRTSSLKNSRSGLFFCCREHKDLSQRMDGLPEIKPAHYPMLDDSKSYRTKVLSHTYKKCSKCGYNTDERMLDVHHKDGDRNNNKMENLEVLCVWCHGIFTRKAIDHSWNGHLIESDN